MTQRRQFVPDEERAHGVGATGGLPGANADPRASLVAEDELASTVGRGDVNDGLLGVEREVDVRSEDDPDVAGHMGDGVGGASSDDPMVDGRLADGSPAPGPTGAHGGADAGEGSDQRAGS